MIGWSLVLGFGAVLLHFFHGFRMSVVKMLPSGSALPNLPLKGSILQNLEAGDVNFV